MEKKYNDVCAGQKFITCDSSTIELIEEISKEELQSSEKYINTCFTDIRLFKCIYDGEEGYYCRFHKFKDYIIILDEQIKWVIWYYYIQLREDTEQQDAALYAMKNAAAVDC